MEQNAISLRKKKKEKEILPLLEGILLNEQDPIYMERLSKMINSTSEEIKKYIERLKSKYNNNSFSSIKITTYNNQVELNIKPDIRAEINKINNNTSNELTAIVDDFLFSKQSFGISESTLGNYRLVLTDFITKINKPVENINRKDIRHYLMQLKKQGNSQSTICSKFRTISSLFAWLVAEDYIPKNITLKMKISEGEDKDPEPFTHEQIENLREAAAQKSLFDRTLIEVLYSSGVRISEAEKLDWADIDFNSKTLRIRKGKGNKTRTTLLSTKAIMLLKELKSNRKDEKPWVFQSRYKKRMSRASLYRHIKKVGDKAGMNNDENDNVKPHRFRHSFASHLLESGMPLHEVQKLMGHTKPSTTQIYALTTNENVRHSYSNVFH